MHTFSLLLTGWLLGDMCHCFVVFSFFKYYIILELWANFTVRRHILLFFFFFAIDWSYGERERREERKEEDG